MVVWYSVLVVLGTMLVVLMFTRMEKESGTRKTTVMKEPKISSEVVIAKGNWIANCITEAKVNSVFKGNEYHIDTCIKQGDRIFKQE